MIDEQSGLPSIEPHQCVVSPSRRGCKVVSLMWLVTIALLIVTSVSAHAQTAKDWSGAISSDWFQADNWVGGRPTQSNSADINTVTPNATVIEQTGAAAQNLVIGQSGIGMLTVQAGGTLTDSFAAIGNGPLGEGTVTVTGTGSSWATNGSIVVGGRGTGILTTQNGGTLSSSGASIGLSAGSTGVVTVTGAGSTWFNGFSGGLNVGSSGTGTLTIADGAQVTNSAAAEAANIGNRLGSQGTVTVTGAGSTWRNLFGLSIGNAGVGTLTVADGGTVTGATIIAKDAGSIGTLNIGAAPNTSIAAAGIINEQSIAFGAGTGTINFNHSSADYVFAPAINGNGAVNVFSGTTIFTGANSYSGATTIEGGILQVGAGGTTGTLGTGSVTNNSMLVFNRSDALQVSNIIGGTGSLTQSGTGVLTLATANTYSGGTYLAAGTLQVGNDSALGSGTLAMANSTVLGFTGNRSLANAVTLQGSSMVEVLANQNVILSGTIADGASAGTLNKTGSGTLVLTGASTHTGGTSIQAGTLQAGEDNSLSATSDHTVNTGATLALQGFNQNVMRLTNAGLVDLRGAAVGTRLTTGNYVGSGGRLALNTVLGADNSPSDRLLIDAGSATGRSQLLISNAKNARGTKGGGALTTGNGILIVDTMNGASTAASAFKLANPVLAGPYEYTLYRGSVDNSGPQNWYLRTTIDCAVVSNPACPPTLPTEPVDPSVPVEPSVPSRPIPNYRPEVALYTAIAPMAILYNRTLLDTLHERVGEETQQRGRTDLGDKNDPNGSWLRVITMGGNRDSREGVYGDSPSYEYDFQGLQLGHDLYRQQLKDGSRDLAGVYFAAGMGEGDPDNFGENAGTDYLDGYSFAGYWTHFGDSDWYLDGILQTTYYEIEADPSRTELNNLTTEGWGFAGSIEGGYPFHLSDLWVIEPQAQLVYQSINLEDSKDLAAKLSFDNVDSLASRLGVRVAKTWDYVGAADSHKFTAWGRISAWYEGRGKPETEFSSANGIVPFQGDINGGWWETKLGLTGEIKANTSIYTSIGFQEGFDNDREAWDVKIGVQMSF